MRPVILIPGRESTYRNYRLAIEAAGGRAFFSECGRCPPKCDGLLLPGGGDVAPWRYGPRNTASTGVDAARDALELGLLNRFVSVGRPVLGICRGIQVINVAFGGTLRQDIPGHSQSAGMDRVHHTRVATSFLTDLYGYACVVNSAHHQAVERLGHGLRAVQWAPDGTVEALEHEKLPLWAVQWHPERLRGNFAKQGAADGGRLFQAFVECCRGGCKKSTKWVDIHKVICKYIQADDFHGGQTQV